MKKLELLRGVIEQFHLTPQEVVEYFVNNKVVNIGFLEDTVNKTKNLKNITFIPSQKYVVPNKIQPGMFEYASGLISEELIKEEQLRGIVGYVDDNEILVWCLRSKKLCWSEYYRDFGTTNKELRGWEATQKVLETAERLGKVAPAAQWSVDYAEDGVQKGSAFLPSYADYELLKPKIKKVKNVFRKIDLNFGDTLGSSSEYNDNFVWGLYVNSSDRLDYYHKGFTTYVRPVRRILR